MTLAELIARVRTDANDRAQPYFWRDEDIAAWLNDAVAEAAIRSRLLHESADAEVCRIAVIAGASTYPLHPSLYELDHVAYAKDGDSRVHPIGLRSPGTLDASMSGWRDRSGCPEFAIQGDTSLRLVPTPDAPGELRLEGYRVPLAPMELEEKETAVPEIGEIHHPHLVHWALHRGFSIPDMESFDPQRAATAEAEFTRYFGIRPDADLCRMTREDVPHHVEAFWA